MIVDDGSLMITVYIRDDTITVGEVLQDIKNKEFIVIKLTTGECAGNYYLYTTQDFILVVDTWKRYKPDILTSNISSLPSSFFSSHLLKVFEADEIGEAEDYNIRHINVNEFILVVKNGEIVSLHTGVSQHRKKPIKDKEEGLKPLTYNKNSTDDLLSTELSTGPTPPPLPANRYINSWLKDRADNPIDPDQTMLEKEQVYNLYFDIDTVSRKESLLENVLIRYTHKPGEDVIPITVRLETDDFDYFGEKEKILYLPPAGPSKNNISFSISPKHDGELAITAVFLKENQFIQLCTIKFNMRGDQLSKRSDFSRGLDHLDSLQARDINITIVDMGTDYQFILSGSVSTTARLRLKLPELKAISEEARQSLMNLVNCKENNRLVYQESISIPGKVCNANLPLLAETGFRIYQKIFFNPDSDSQAQNVGKKLRKILQGPRCKIQIFAQDFVLPWGILYLADRFDPKNIDPDLFLGLRHIIEYLPLQEEMLITGNEILCQEGLTISLNINKDIDIKLGPLVKSQENYWEKICSTIPTINLIKRTIKEDVMQAIADNELRDQIIYFYCHGAMYDLEEAGGVDASTLILTGNTRITMKDFDLEAPITDKLVNAPLVFINACESAKLSPLVYDGFVPYFIAKGARGVIGSECKLPARFAVEWAKRFFDRFLTGQSIGEAVFDLRKEFFEKEHNLLGLLYALYVDCDTRLTPPVLVV